MYVYIDFLKSQALHLFSFEDYSDRIFIIRMYTLCHDLYIMY